MFFYMISHGIVRNINIIVLGNMKLFNLIICSVGDSSQSKKQKCNYKYLSCFSF